MFSRDSGRPPYRKGASRACPTSAARGSDWRARRSAAARAPATRRGRSHSRGATVYHHDVVEPRVGEQRPAVQATETFGASFRIQILAPFKISNVAPKLRTDHPDAIGHPEDEEHAQYGGLGVDVKGRT